MGRRSKQRRLNAAAKEARENTDSGENSTTAGSGASSREDGRGTELRQSFHSARMLGFPGSMMHAPFFDDSHGHHRDGPFFRYLDKDAADSMPHPPSFADPSGEGENFSPGTEPPYPRSRYPFMPEARVPYPEELGAGSHLGFLSDAGREPTTYALAELAKENLALKNKLRAVISEVQRLQEIIKQREVGGAGGGGGGSSSYSKSASDSKKSQSRYWTDEEHQLFLEGMQRFGPKDMKGIAKHVGTRSSTQVRTHAQKYFLKLARAKKRSDPSRSNGSGSSTNSAGEECFHPASASDCYFSSYDALGGAASNSVRWSSSPGENTSSGGDESLRCGGGEKLAAGGASSGSSAAGESSLRLSVE